jgi:hypothetical protein
MMKSHMTIHVKEDVGILICYMKTYTERQLIGQQLLNTHVVTEPESWSNQGLINEGELISE